MNQELLKVLESGTVEELERLIANGVDIKQSDTHGNTALLLAATNGHIAMLEHLLKNGYSNIKETNNHGNTALLMAARNGQVSMLEHLLEKSYSSIKETNRYGNTALLLAAGNGRIAMLEHLLKKNYSNIKETNDSGDTALLWAAWYGQISMLEHLLKNGYSNIKETDKNGTNALLMAAWNGQIAMLEHLLLKPEVSLEEINKSNGDNVLSLSAWMGHSEMVSFLLEKGVYIDMLLNDGRRVRTVIENHTNKAALTLLIASEELFDLARGAETQKSLMVAENLIETTLKKALNARQIKTGNTALHVAIIEKRTALVKLLLEKGADVLMPNRSNETSFQLIQKAYQDNPDILLLNYLSALEFIEKSVIHKRKTQTISESLPEIKKAKEEQRLETKETKEIKETKEEQKPFQKMSLDELQFECGKILQSMREMIDKLPSDGLEENYFRMGKMLSDVSSPLFDAALSYNILQRISNPKTNSNFVHFKEIHNLMAGLLISGKIRLEFNQKNEAQAVNHAAAEGVLDKAMPLDLEESASVKTADEKYQLRAIIAHILHGDGAHSDALGGYIASYTGCENGVKGIAGVRGKDVASHLALIEDLKNEREISKKKDLENRKLLEEVKKLKEKIENLERVNSNTVSSNSMLMQFSLSSLKGESGRHSNLSTQKRN